jgi:hypothetical protein
LAANKKEHFEIGRKVQFYRGFRQDLATECSSEDQKLLHSIKRFFELPNSGSSTTSTSTSTSVAWRSHLLFGIGELLRLVVVIVTGIDTQ